MSLDSIKINGCCTICDKPVYEVVNRFPEGHILQGKVDRIGQPLDKAMIVTYVLSNGSATTLTVCEGCIEDARAELSAVWLKCQRSNRWYLRHEAELYGQHAPRRNAEQQAQVRKDLAASCDLFILGVAKIEKWSERLARDFRR